MILPRPSADRLAGGVRIAVVASAACALAFQIWLGAQEWPLLLPWAGGAFVAAAALTRLRPAAAWALLLAPAYVYPVLLLAARGAFLPAYHAVWLAGLFGVIVAAAPPGRWHLPSAWRLPLAFAALAVALAWPLVALREMNFAWASIGQYSLANSGLGGPPPVVIVNALLVVLTQLLGILWFDTMFARLADDRAVRRAIVVPLMAGLACGSALAVYQWTVDPAFLSAHQWPVYRRAAGGLVDGNAFGVLAGMWSAAALALALTGRHAYYAGGLVVALLCGLAVWATGSRMALLTAVIGLAFIALAAISGGFRLGSRRAAAAVAALVLVAVALGAAGRFRMDPVSRTIKSFQKRPDIAAFVEFEFWNRFGPFGSASVQMIKDSPIVGVGAGTFEVLYPDYAYVVTGGATRSHFDNAQSWYRHRLAELGLLGSLGWIAWLVVFGAFVWKAAPSRDGLTEATGVKAALVAIAVISIVSMPTRNTFVALTFWVFAFWLVKATAAPPETGRLANLSRTPAAWIAVSALALAFAAVTGWVAHTQLRPPYRALMAAWNYVNGISRPVRTGEGVRLFARKDGVAVFAARPGYLRLVFQVPHEDAVADPVRVRVFERNDLQANLLIGDRDEHTLYVRVPEGDDRMMIRTSVSREVPPSDEMPARALILHNWSFVRQPPPGALIGGEISAGRSPRNP